MRTSFLLLGLCVFWYGCTTTKSPSHMQITFRVLSKILPDTAVVYLTGNQSELGNWKPDSIALARQADSSWSRTFAFPPGTRLEYKITRGSWRNEATNAEGMVLPNAELVVTRDTTITIVVENWRDAPQKPAAQITGTVRYHRRVAGEGLRPRDVIVWLPPGYEAQPQNRYPVLYMHDGQNVFDPNTSFLGVDWQADEVADSLIKAGAMQEIIIVGVYNTDDRVQEYADTPKGRAYMKFMVETLKPFIDANYRTLPQREHTATLGSSMGGLISFLLVWHYPEVFYQAGCMSPAFTKRYSAVIQMVAEDEGPLKDIRIYMDNGGVGLDSVLQAGCDGMLRALESRGFSRDENLQWFRDRSAEHSERAWARRVWRPLLFMFGQRSL